MKTKIVHVQWHDSSAIYGWKPRENLRRYKKDLPMVIDSVGLLVHKGKDKIILLQSISPDEIDGVFEIPRACIRSMKTIGRVKHK